VTAAARPTRAAAAPRPARRLAHPDLAKQLVLLLAALLVLFPAYFVVITAFKSQDAYALDKIGFPSPVVVDNFVTALRGGRFLLWFLNSVILCLGAVALSAVVSVLAAFAFARMRFAARGPILSAVTSLMVVPPVVMIVPQFLLLTRLDLISTYPGAILVYAGLITPFSVYLLTNFFRTIPHEIVEAALIDGASPLGILRLIVLPLSGPPLVTMVVVNALWVWNDLLVALVLLPKDELRTLMVGINVFGTRFNNDVPVQMAGMLLASVPMLIVYLLGQRYFIRGLVAGAVKS
jgi:ABC-type glycerol-3-phosphate transport system permease component